VPGDLDELERAVSVIEQAAIQASCETRRIWANKLKHSQRQPYRSVDRSDCGHPFTHTPAIQEAVASNRPERRARRSALGQDGAVP